MKLLFLDDDPARVPMIPRSVDLYYVRTPKEFMEWLSLNGTPDAISYDHDLAQEQYGGNYTMSASGADCARWAIENGFIPKRIHIHSWNSVGAQKIANLFLDHFKDEPYPDAEPPTIVVRPFNPYKPHLWTEE